MEVTVDVGACPAPGSLTVPVTVTIDPADSAVVTITGPGGPYVVDGDGAVLDLAAGDYTATVEAADGFSIEDDTIEFTVPACPPDDEPAMFLVDDDGAVLDLAPGDYTAAGVAADGFDLEVVTVEFKVADCPPVPAAVEVNVGACPPTSSATRPVTVTIDPANAADVEISVPGGYNEVVTGDGATGNLAPGTYTFTATANPGFELTGAAEGTFTVGNCVIELPRTGANVGGLVGVGLAFLSVGFGMTRLSRRSLRG